MPIKGASLFKVAAAACSVATTIGGMAECLPPGKAKYALVGVGMAGTSLPALFSQVHQHPVSATPARTPDLKAGDILLYRGVGLYGAVITLKTWHPEGHIETYIGSGQAFASRDGLGTGVYPLRLSDLMVVCRPKVPVDVAGALVAYHRRGHQPYGWLDLLNFVGVSVDSGGIVCSAAGAQFARWAGYDPFNGEPVAKIAPFQFTTQDCYDVYDVQPDGELVRRAVAEVAHA